MRFLITQEPHMKVYLIAAAVNFSTMKLCLT